jgi:hypothetical protein
LYEQKVDFVIGVNVSQENKWIVKQMAMLKRIYRDLLQKEGKEMKEMDKYAHDVNIIESSLRSLDMILHQIAIGEFKNSKADIVIKPDVQFAGRYNVTYIEEIIGEGEREARKQMPKILKSLKEKGIKI